MLQGGGISDERNYEYTYDELIPPKLIKIIDKGSFKI